MNSSYSHILVINSFDPSDSIQILKIKEQISKKYNCKAFLYGDMCLHLHFHTSELSEQDAIKSMINIQAESSSIYVQVLSYEYVSEFVSYQTYTQGRWCEKLANNFKSIN